MRTNGCPTVSTACMPQSVDYFVDETVGPVGTEGLVLELFDCSLLNILKQAKPHMLTVEDMLVLSCRLVRPLSGCACALFCGVDVAILCRCQGMGMEGSKCLCSASRRR